MLENKPKISWWLVASYIIVPLLVSTWSTIHVVRFFELTNNYWLAVGIAISFEIGALAALAGLVAIDKINKNVVWAIFIALTAYQMMANSYAAYDFITQKMVANPDWVRNWSELFGLEEAELPFMKRLLAIISGVIFPLISLGFLDILMNYIMVSMGLKEPKMKKLKSAEPTPIPAVEITDSGGDEDLPKILDRLNAKRQQEESTPPIESETIVMPPGEPEPIIIPTVENPGTISIPTILTPQEVEEEYTFDDDLLAGNWPHEVEKTPTEDSPDESIMSDTEDLLEFIEHKKKRIHEIRKVSLELLDIFYDNGNKKIDDELPRYSEFIQMVDLVKYPENDVKMFLTLCNYLEVFRLTGTKKIATKSYEEAQKIFKSYLQWGN